MFRVVPSPTGGVWLCDEAGVVIESGNNIPALRLALSMAMERREISPFEKIRDEFGRVVVLKDYVRR